MLLSLEFSLELSLVEELAELSVEELAEELFPLVGGVGKLQAASVAIVKAAAHAHSNVIIFLIFFIIVSF